MCGIAGLFSEKLKIDSTRNMLDTMYHRGPDSESEYQSHCLQMGMRRLAINDVENGKQPLFNTQRNVAVIYNGEIYNSPQLRKELIAKGYRFRSGSDGEVICHLYDDLGEELFGHLDGMFAIALWDDSRQRLLLARDQAGEKPLYYATLDQGEGIAFASEIKALRQVMGLNLTLDRQALWDFSTFLWIPEPATVYQQVRALPRGSFLTVDAFGFSIHPYRKHLGPFLTEPLSDRDAVTETRRIVEQAVQSRLLSDVPVGSFLSGGLDSSIVATLATQALGPIDTFSVGFEPLSDPYHGMAVQADCRATLTEKPRFHGMFVSACQGGWRYQR